MIAWMSRTGSDRLFPKRLDLPASVGRGISPSVLGWGTWIRPDYTQRQWLAAFDANLVAHANCSAESGGTGVASP